MVIQELISCILPQSQAKIRESQKEVAVSGRKRSSRLQDMEKEKEAIDAEKRRKQDEQDSKGRELRFAKREQTRAERAAEREERAKAKEVCGSNSLI